jgi:hypothetical protein
MSKPDYRFTLGRIAGIAEMMGFETISPSGMNLTRVKVLLKRLEQTKNAFSVPQIDYPGADEHILFVYHQKSDRLVAAYAVFEGGYIIGCTLSGGNHDLSISEVIMGLHRMKGEGGEAHGFTHYENISFWFPVSTEKTLAVQSTMPV